MKTQSNITCDRVKFDVLLHGDEGSDEFAQSAMHLETCESCRDRLTQVAADEQDWSSVRSSLKSRDYAFSRADKNSWETSFAADDFASAKIPLDFLSAPSHPEMLGRLGRYEVERVIGMGGMGIVLKGYDTELNRPVAIKVLAPHLAHSGAARQRFAREARAAAAVVHEHVVAIHNVESDHETPFLVMQFVSGRSLQERVARQGPLSPSEILRIGMQASAGLAAAHDQGVIHRDVKPANILLENDVERVLLTDFGLARAVDDASLTRSGIIAGTPHYMSPEQANGEPADGRSDLFGLGAVLYFMATGHPPFRAERAMAVLHRICRDRHRPVREINPLIPDELSDVIDRLLEKKPSRRYATATETRDALARVLSDLQHVPRWSARRWLRRTASRLSRRTAACALLIVVAVGAIVAIPWGSSPTTSDQSAVTANQLSNPVPLNVGGNYAAFTRDLQEIEKAATTVAATPFPESVIQQPSFRLWDRELADINKLVEQLEFTTSLPSEPTSNPSPSKGDSP